jgi:pimeloyl-ACP methyl ester carboxylesterase
MAIGIQIFAWTLVAAVALGVAASFAYRLARQRRSAAALAIGTPNGISLGKFVLIGGIKQWIQIRGEDRDNPALLVVHGGPGMSYMHFTSLFRSWEKHFTLIQWDQRGCGKTLGANGKHASCPIAFDRIADDGIELVELLCRELRKDKVFLLGSSVGSLVAVTMAKRRPDLFHAYVGTDQVVDMARNELQSYEMALDRARAAGNKKAIAALERIGAPPYRDVRAWYVKQRWISETDPATTLSWKTAIPMVLFAPNYSLRDIYHCASGLTFCAKHLLGELMSHDLRRLGTKFDVPFFVIQGEVDTLTLTSLTEEYFAAIEAPSKQLVLLKDAGHLAAFALPERFLKELLALLGVASSCSASRSGQPPGAATRRIFETPPRLPVSNQRNPCA